MAESEIDTQVTTEYLTTTGTTYCAGLIKSMITGAITTCQDLHHDVRAERRDAGAFVVRMRTQTERNKSARKGNKCLVNGETCRENAESHWWRDQQDQYTTRKGNAEGGCGNPGRRGETRCHPARRGRAARGILRIRRNEDASVDRWQSGPEGLSTTQKRRSGSLLVQTQTTQTYRSQRRDRHRRTRAERWKQKWQPCSGFRCRK